MTSPPDFRGFFWPQPRRSSRCSRRRQRVRHGPRHERPALSGDGLAHCPAARRMDALATSTAIPANWPTRQRSGPRRRKRAAPAQRCALGRREVSSRVHTPWGTSQGATVYADGVVFHSTAGHGGFHLSPERNRRCIRCCAPGRPGTKRIAIGRSWLSFSATLHRFRKGQRGIHDPKLVSGCVGGHPRQGAGTRPIVDEGRTRSSTSAMPMTGSSYRRSAPTTNPASPRSSPRRAVIAPGHEAPAATSFLRMSTERWPLRIHHR